MDETLQILEELRPLRDPILIAAFTGGGDTAGSAAATVAYLSEHWGARRIATIDPEPYHDFTVRRPMVRLDDGKRVLEWPDTRFHLAQPAGAGRDIVLLVGVEPSLRWRTFTEVVAELMRAVGVTTSVTLGTQPAAVPHTRALPPVALVDAHPDIEELFGLKSITSAYQGPTDITGAMSVHHRSLGWRTATLWATVPHYLNLGPNPNAAMAFVQTLDAALHTSTELGALEENVRAFAARTDAAIKQSPEAEDYVRLLEERYDAASPAGRARGDGGGPTSELPPAAEVVDELERFLRERRASGE